MRQLHLLVLTLFVTTASWSQVPGLLTYQGRIAAYGTNFNGTGQFKFALVNSNGTVSFWSHDNSSVTGAAPATAVAVAVTNGLYSVLLGSTATIPPAVFTNADVRLRVWFSDGIAPSQRLTPDQRLAAAPYALNAATLSGSSASAFLATTGGTVSGSVTFTNPGNAFAGSGSGLTTLSASELVSGQVDDARLSPNVARLAGPASFAVTVSAPAFSGNGNALTSLNAGNLSSGTLPSARLTGVYSGALTLTNPANVFAGNGAGLTNLNVGTSVWTLSGNAGSYSSFIGTTNNAPLALRAGNARVALFDHDGIFGLQSIILGFDHPWSSTAQGVTISGGYTNQVDLNASFSTISGGRSHIIAESSLSSVIGGGEFCLISTNVTGGTIGGGVQNRILRDSFYATIGGGWTNTISSGNYGATIGGGMLNSIQVNADYAAIGGGLRNTNDNGATYATIAGGNANRIGPDAQVATLSGGSQNLIGPLASAATIGGGAANTIGSNAYNSVIAGGANHLIGADTDHSTISGGSANVISNTSPYSSITGGRDNVIGTNSPGSAILSGVENAVAPNASNSVAMGTRARANHRGSFVWGDVSTLSTIASTNANSWTVRAVGGVRFISAVTTSNPTAGVVLTPGSGSWGSVSDRRAKENIVPVDPLAVLDKVAALPLATWNYKTQPATTRHIGPMAQDFAAAFGVGDGDTTITTIDADGVALAAIQGLHQRLQSENAALRQQLEQQRIQLEELKRRLDSVAPSTATPTRP